jgi:hypothetical protein
LSGAGLSGLIGLPAVDGAALDLPRG